MLACDFLGHQAAFGNLAAQAGDRHASGRKGQLDSPRKAQGRGFVDFLLHKASIAPRLPCGASAWFGGVRHGELAFVLSRPG